MDPKRWKQIEDILHSALDLAPEQLDPFLRKACEGDESLEHEVRRLLSVERHADSFLQRPAAEAAASLFDSNPNTPRLPDSDLAGSMVKHFRILEKLGSGGMGVVYKAEDTRLHRFVALKFLSEEFARHPEALSRFRREAQAASALNHPNICSIYDLDEQDDSAFIVMEYIAGQTLDATISLSGLPLAELLPVAIQVAEGLRAAHAAGIVHRDLKPSNIMRADNGVVKILDFGLAKLTPRPSEESAAEAGMHPPSSRTLTGAVMGTAAYMSPEQVESRPVDARSDIFSFGVVLYEMLTGRKPFLRDTTAATLEAILRDSFEPVQGIPEDVRRLLDRCLQKDPSKRAQSAAEVKARLEQIAERPGRQWKWAAFAAAVALLAVASWLVLARKASPEPFLVKPLTSYPGGAMSPSFSPDGNQVAFEWSGEYGNPNNLYVKKVGAEAPLRLTNSRFPDQFPAWSPDGRQIAFLRVSWPVTELRLISPRGGPERKLANLTRQPGVAWWWTAPAWTNDNKYLAVRDDTAIVLVSVETGEKRKLTSPPPGWDGDFFPAISPDGRTLAFARRRVYPFGEIFLAPLADPTRIRQLTHEARTVSGLAWTADGGQIVFSAGRLRGASLWRIPAAGGTAQQLPGIGVDAVQPAISRQGRHAAFARCTARMSFWKVDLSPQGLHRPPLNVLRSSRLDANPMISPDGRHIAFQSDRSADYELWVCDSDGSNAVQLTHLGRAGTPSWSPDGRSIAFAGGWDPRLLFVIASSGGQPRRLTSENITAPSWSRDGRWIYFLSKGAAVDQVWKIAPDGGKKIQVTKGGGGGGMESLDGRYFYYHKLADNALWKVPADGGEETLITKERINYYNFWTLGTQGLYFTAPRPKEHKSILKLFRFETGQSTPLAVLDQPIPTAQYRLSITADSRWLLYDQLDRDECDLMLIENFN